MTCGLKNDMRNLANLTTALESVKVGTLIGTFCPQQKMYEFKIYRGLICHDNENIDMRKLKNFDSNTRKSKIIAL